MTYDPSLADLRASYERALKFHPLLLILCAAVGLEFLKWSIPFLTALLFWPPYIAWGFFSALSLDSKIVVGLVLGYSLWSSFLSLVWEYLLYISTGIVVTLLAFLMRVLPQPKRRGVDRFGTYTEERTLLSLKEEDKRR